MPAEDPARNLFFRFSLKRSLGSGFFSIALAWRSGRMETNQRLVYKWNLKYICRKGRIHYARGKRAVKQDLEDLK